MCVCEDRCSNMSQQGELNHLQPQFIVPVIFSAPCWPTMQSVPKLLWTHKENEEKNKTETTMHMSMTHVTWLQHIHLWPFSLLIEGEIQNRHFWPSVTWLDLFALKQIRKILHGCLICGSFDIFAKFKRIVHPEWMYCDLLHILMSFQTCKTYYPL